MVHVVYLGTHMCTRVQAHTHALEGEPAALQRKITSLETPAGACAGACDQAVQLQEKQFAACVPALP